MLLHPTPSGAAPPLFSATRITMLVTSLLVALASGTNYVFSAYGPQLSARLHLSHTQLNIVGLSGNVGVYGTAPFWGRIVDSKGPRPLLILAFVALLLGYNGIRHFYDAGLPEGATDLSTFAFCILVLCGFLTGIGGNGGLTSAMNSTAKSFPDGLRATTNGVVLSGFGLSAFLFSSIAHVVFPGDTSEFLLVLAIGTSLPMILGFFLVRAIPLPHSEGRRAVETGHDNDDDNDDDDAFSAISPAIFHRENNSHTHLLAPHTHHHHNSDEEDSSDEELVEGPEFLHEASPSDYVVPGAANALALSPTRSTGDNRYRSRSAFSVPRRAMVTHKTHDGLPNIRGMALVKSRNFWLLFLIITLLSGTGLMYINNVGSICQALFAKGNPDFDDRKAAQWQATQVSTISITNCLGRILIGLTADFTKNKLRFPRSFCISLVALGFIISQVIVYSVDNVSELWKGSAVLGLAYGGLFGLFPTITIEWFGLPHFSENWGFVSFSPMIGGNVFSIAFGRNLDAHAPAEPSSGLNNTLTSTPQLAVRGGFPDSDTSHQCLLGRECYAGSLVMTIMACSVALALALYAGWRDYCEGRRLEIGSREPLEEVLWEDDET